MTGKRDEGDDRVRELADALDMFLSPEDGSPSDARLGETGQELLRMMQDAPPDLGEESPTAGNGPTSLSLVGSTLGDFKLQREIGRGGMGLVFLAEQVSLTRHVALKVLPRHLSYSEARVARFHREAVAAAKLRHPNIVPVYSVGKEREHHYFAMQYVEGETLADLIARLRDVSRSEAAGILHEWAREREAGDSSGSGPSHGAIPIGGASDIAVCAGIALRVAQALGYAHEQGVIHRDVKPSNILLDRAGTPLVADFGLAKDEEAEGLSITGDLLGTPYYMAPERVDGPRDEVDGRSDIFSLGVTLYELLALKRPFEAETSQEVLKLVTGKEPKPLRKEAPWVPRDLETIVLRALEKNPDQRYRSAHDLAADLQRFLELRPIEARPVSPVERIVRGMRRYPARTLAAVLLVLLVVGGPLVFGLQERAARRNVEREKKETELQRKEAEAERDAKTLALERSLGLYLSAQSRLLGEENPGLALLLAIEGARRAPDPVSRAALYRALESTHALGAERRTLVGHDRPVHHATIDAAARTILTSGDDKTARLWDLESGELLTTLRGHLGPVRGGAFSPDGARVFTRSRDATVRGWDAATGTELFLVRHREPVGSMAISPDGTRLVTGSRNGVLRVTNTTDGNTVHTIEEHTGPILRIRFDRSGERFVTASADGTVRVFDTVSGRALLPPCRHRDVVFDAGFCPDGRWLYSASRDRTARTWDATTGRELTRMTGHLADITAMSVRPDGASLLTASADQTARVFDPRTGELLHLIRHEDCVIAVEHAPGDRFLTASWDGTVRLHGNDGTELARMTGHEDRVLSATFAPGGHRIVSTSTDGTARTWSVEEEALAPHRIVGHDGPVHQARFHPEKPLVLTGSHDQSSVLWNLTTGRRERSLPLHKLGVIAVDLSADGRLALTASRDGTARVTDLETGDTVHWIRHGHPLSSAALDPTGRRLITVSRVEGEARIWDLETEETILTLRGQRDMIWCAAFSPDGQRILTTDSGTAHLWSAITGEKLRSLKGHRGWIKWVEWSRDGTRILTASRDGTACLWDATRDDRVDTMPLLTLHGHELGLWCAAMSPDGTRIVTASEDGTAVVWNASTGEEIVTLEGHDGQVLFARFSPDGRTILTASRDHTVRLWPVDPLAAALPHRPRALTRRERDRFGIWEGEDREAQSELARKRETARELVTTLKREHVLLADVAETLRDDRDLDPVIRDEALSRLDSDWDDPEVLNNESWVFVATPHETREAYERALRWARAACTLAPGNGTFRNTLGVALYRLERHDEALDALLQARELNGDFPLDTAFLAMVWKRRGEEKKAAEALSRLDRNMQELPWKTLMQDVYREALAVVRDGRSSDDH